MLKKRAMGIIFANMHDGAVPDMTRERSMASLPFGGRYRMIDFNLSALVNAGISQVAVVAKSNYQSLMDHIESGRDWDLARRKGITILPPYSYTSADSNTAYHGRISALYGIMSYIENANAETVVMMDCDHVVNLDLEEMIESHYANKADVTIACKEADYDPDNLKNCVSLKADDTGRVTDLMVNHCEEGFMQSINVFVIGRKLLMELVQDAMARMNVIFERDILLANLKTMNIHAFRYDGYIRRITGMRTYFEANMDLLHTETVDALFGPRTIYTKVHDSPPTRYGLDCDVKNSVVADGCTLEGVVENSVLFRGVKIGKNAVVKNCLIFQDCEIMDGCVLENVILDKDIIVRNGKALMGAPTYPVVIAKGSVI